MSASATQDGYRKQVAQNNVKCPGDINFKLSELYWPQEQQIAYITASHT